MRIAFVIPAIQHSAGGPTVVTVNLSRRLCDCGNEVVVLTTNIGRGGDQMGGLADFDPRINLKMLHVDSLLDRRIYRSSALAAWLRRNVSDFDVVDIQGVWSFIAVDAARICRENKVPYVITPHGQMAAWDWGKRPVAKAVFYHLFLREAWGQATAIRFLSDLERTRSVASARGRSEVVPNAVELPDLSDQGVRRGCFRRSLNIPEEAPLILFLGRITEQKGVLELVQSFGEVWSHHRTAFLALVGPSDKAYGDAVRKCISRLSGKVNVRVLGPLYGSSRFDAMAAADMYVSLSKNEGHPVAVLEAMSWGLPVLISREANIAEVEDCGAGRIAPTKEFAVASVLKEMISDKAELRRMGRYARSLVAQHYTWDIVTPQITTLYQTVARMQQPRSEG